MIRNRIIFALLLFTISIAASVFAWGPSCDPTSSPDVVQIEAKHQEQVKKLEAQLSSVQAALDATLAEIESQKKTVKKHKARVEVKFESSNIPVDEQIKRFSEIDL